MDFCFVLGTGIKLRTLCFLGTCDITELYPSLNKFKVSFSFFSNFLIVVVILVFAWLLNGLLAVLWVSLLILPHLNMMHHYAFIT